MVRLPSDLMLRGMDAFHPLPFTHCCAALEVNDLAFPKMLLSLTPRDDSLCQVSSHLNDFLFFFLINLIPLFVS